MNKLGSPQATKSVKLLLADGQIIESELVYYPRYRSLFRAGGYCIDLNIDKVGRCSYRGINYFAALSEIRRKLETKGIRILCWGASKKAWPSHMQRDMGTGLEVHELVEGGDTGPTHLIFDYLPPEKVGTVDEQKTHAEQWFQSKLKTTAPK